MVVAQGSGGGGRLGFGYHVIIGNLDSLGLTIVKPHLYISKEERVRNI